MIQSNQHVLAKAGVRLGARYTTVETWPDPPVYNLGLKPNHQRSALRMLLDSLNLCA